MTNVLFYLAARSNALAMDARGQRPGLLPLVLVIIPGMIIVVGFALLAAAVVVFVGLHALGLD